MSIHQMLLAGAGAFQFNPTIAANTLNYNVKTAAIAAGWDQISPLVSTVTVNAGVYVGSSTTGGYGFDTGSSYPAGSSLTLVNNGFIIGAGGAGAPGWPTAGGPAATAGGTALIARVPLKITNSGTIGGGGGGGGGGQNSGNTYQGGGGGGGAGYNGGAGGGGYPGGSPGTYTTGGAGGAGTPAGGAGGNLGAAGSAGSSSAGAGAGAAVSGNANITWLAAGTRLGAIA